MNLIWKFGLGVALLPKCDSRLWAKPVFTAYPFTLGVASGDPLPDSVVLWTRLAPEPLQGGRLPMVAIEVQWQIGFDEQMSTLVRSGTAMAYAELGHSVHVEVAGLEPAREYWYRFIIDGIQSPVGRTRTAPAAGSEVEHLRFGVCGCNHYEQADNLSRQLA